MKNGMMQPPPRPFGRPMDGTYFRGREAYPDYNASSPGPSAYADGEYNPEGYLQYADELEPWMIEMLDRELDPERNRLLREALLAGMRVGPSTRGRHGVPTTDPDSPWYRFRQIIREERENPDR